MQTANRFLNHLNVVLDLDDDSSVSARNFLSACEKTMKTFLPHIAFSGPMKDFGLFKEILDLQKVTNGAAVLFKDGSVAILADAEKEVTMSALDFSRMELHERIPLLGALLRGLGKDSLAEDFARQYAKKKAEVEVDKFASQLAKNMMAAADKNKH